MMKKECSHCVTMHKENESGLFCVLCGDKIYEKEINRCCLCKYSKKLWLGWVCKKKLMTIDPDMRILYKISDGSCFQKR